MPDARSTRLIFEEVLGRGGFGSVYRARLVRGDGMSRRVAVKLLNPEVKGIREAARRTRDEARMLSRLNHDHIIGVFDLTELDGSPAVIMEYVEGSDLKGFIRAGRTPPRVALQICARIASALHAAHTAENHETGEPLALVHRDIKPGNVLVSSEGGVKLLDFGVAFGELERESRTQVEQVGTLRYMAPEQFLGGKIGHASDIYALGVVLMELLLGRALERLPVEAERFELARRRLLSELSELEMPTSWGIELVTLVERLLSLTAEERPSGKALRNEALALADRGPGPSLATYAQKLVPKLLSERRSQFSGVPVMNEMSLGESGFLGETPHAVPSSGAMETFMLRDSETSSETMIPEALGEYLLPPVADETESMPPGGARGVFTPGPSLDTPSQVTGVPADKRGVGLGVLVGLGLAAVIAIAAVVLLGGPRGGESAEGPPVASEAPEPVLEAVDGGVLRAAEAPEPEAAVASTDPGAEAGGAATPTTASPPPSGNLREPRRVRSAAASTDSPDDPAEAASSTAATSVEEAEAAEPESEDPALETEDEPAVADATADEPEAAVEVAVAAPSEPEAAPAPPTFAGLSGRWEGTVGGRPAGFELRFDDSGGVAGVVTVQVGGSQDVVKVAGSYDASSDEAGTVTVRETGGRNPAVYSGSIRGGSAWTGKLTVGGKERGELSLKRR